MNTVTFVPKHGDAVTLSALGLGVMRMPTVEGKTGAPIDRKTATEMIDLAVESGINYYDTAYIYHGGESESFLGEALVDRYDRDSFYLASKYNIALCPADYRAVFEEQLSRLHTDRIDFYLIHALTDDKEEDYLSSGCIEYFEQMRKEGKIRYLGFSSHASPTVLAHFADAHPWDFAQIQYNYLDCIMGNAEEQYEILASRGIPVVVMEPVRGGRLAKLNERAETMLRAKAPDRSMAGWALRFVANKPAVHVVLSGMSTPDQLKDNIKTFSSPLPYLSDSEEKAILAAAEIFRKDVFAACTGCRYCVDGCPSGIEIPDMMTLFNAYRLDGAGRLKRTAKDRDKKSFLDCIGCGACDTVCPQSVAVSDAMKEMTEKAAPFLAEE